MAKFCANCGKELNEGADVCVGCGALVNKKADTLEEDVDKKAKNGMIFGIVSIIAWIIPLFGYITTILGITNSVKGLKSESKKGMAIAGLILSIIFLLASVGNSIAGVMQNLETL